MCEKYFFYIYLSYKNKYSININCIEKNSDFMSFNNTNKIDDIYLYNKLFSNKCCVYVDNLYLRFIYELKKKKYEESFDIINFFIFIQYIVSKAIWKYGLNVSDRLESFVRDFDRMDLESERRRFYYYVFENNI